MFKLFNKSKNAVAASFLAFCLGLAGLLAVPMANADTAALVSSAQTAVGDAGTAAQTVGGYVVLAVAGLIVVGMIIQMMRKV